MRLGDRLSAADKRRLAMLYSNNAGGFVIPRAGLAAAFDANTGITSSAGFASAWADQSGNGRNLLQATGANQPIHLPFAGTKYGYLPGVAGNYFSTPDSAANRVTGTIDIDVGVAASDWTPAVGMKLLAKLNASAGAGQWCYDFTLNATTGLLSARFSHDGSTLTSFTSSVAPTVSDGGMLYVRVVMVPTNGANSTATYYTSADRATWTQLGTQQTSTARASIFAGSDAVGIGGYPIDGSTPLAGKVYVASIYSGNRDAGGTLAVDFDASRWTSGSTFTAATGETWTINSTGSKPAQIVDRPSLLFDGAAHYMKCSSFTLNQPETVYLVAKQVSWTLQDYLYDGETTNTMILYQSATTPNIRMYAGATGNENSGLAVGSRGVIASVFNGASSSSQVNTGSVVTMDAGASNAGGFTMGSVGAGSSNFSNIQAYEALIYNVAHDAATRSNVIRALMSKHGVA